MNPLAEKQPSFATKDFPWTGTDDDFTCNLGDYELRVEQMRKHIWWFRVYFKEETLTANEWSGTKLGAVKECQDIYLGHSKR